MALALLFHITPTARSDLPVAPWPMLEGAEGGGGASLFGLFVAHGMGAQTMGQNMICDFAIFDLFLVIG